MFESYNVGTGLRKESELSNPNEGLQENQLFDPLSGVRSETWGRDVGKSQIPPGIKDGDDAGAKMDKQSKHPVGEKCSSEQMPEDSSEAQQEKIPPGIKENHLAGEKTGGLEKSAGENYSAPPVAPVEFHSVPGQIPHAGHEFSPPGQLEFRSIPGYAINPITRSSTVPRQAK